MYKSCTNSQEQWNKCSLRLRINMNESWGIFPMTDALTMWPWWHSAKASGSQSKGRRFDKCTGHN